MNLDILDFLTHLPIAASLSPDAIQALSVELEPRKISSGSILFRQGDEGDAFYILASGKLLVTVDPTGKLESFTSEVKPGEFVGEMALLTGQPRSATVEALEDGELLCLGKSAYERLVLAYPALLSGLFSQLSPRFQRDQTRLVLKHFFGNINDEHLRGMLGQMDCRYLESGEVLFRQGDPGDAMYIIIQGRLRFVLEGSSGRQRILGEAGAGESAGEFALLAESGTPESCRSATAYAVRSTDMVVITRAIFDMLISQHSATLLNLTRKIVRRTISRDLPFSASETSMSIALLPIRAGRSLETFAEHLADSLSQIDSTILLNSRRFDQLYGKADTSSTALDHPLSLVINVWLDEREREHKYMIYDASPLTELSGWARRCVEKADVILLVAETGTDPRLTNIEKSLSTLHSRPRVGLVLLHPGDCQIPSETAEWLSSRRTGAGSVEAHFHVRDGNQADFRRLARCIIGKPIGLALEGGGARGWAHLGVLRALEESNIEVDYIAGTSMGAIIAAGYAMDWSTKSLWELAGAFSNPKKLLDYTLPYASITSTKRITDMLRGLFADTRIEDTWRPFFCISVDLSHGRELMHTSGPLWKAVRASMAFPGIFAPILDDGRVLIDGGAANNLPIDRMREMCPTGTVIGVHLLETSPVNKHYDFGPSLSGWDVLLSRFSPFKKRIVAPTLMDIISGIVYSNNCYRLNETWNKADLIIRVPAGEFGLLDFDKYARIADLGYRAALEQLKGFTARV